MAFNEETVINQIAAQERAIAGIKNSYAYATNPDTLPSQELPAVIHFSPTFSCDLRANFNVWKNDIGLRSVLFVSPRADSGGKLKYVENAAIPFGQKWRDRFQDGTVINSLMTNIVGVKIFLAGGDYGAGGNLLTFGGTEYIGWVFKWTIVSA